jgi:hypothetical protein
MNDAPGHDTPAREAPGPGQAMDMKYYETEQGAAMPGITSRRLLARLRDVMAGSGSAQHRLDKIVTLIGAEMGADVCSCYVMRAGDILELFATVGLDQ